MHGRDCHNSGNRVNYFPDIRSAARALDGEVSGGQILCPGPGHSSGDRSLTVKPDRDAPDGFVVHSFAGDDPIRCKDHVRDRLQLDAFRPRNNQEKKNGKADDPIIATYVYTDPESRPLHRVCRRKSKDFFQQRYENGNWISGLNGINTVLYRWPELVKYPDAAVFVCEGEKDADRVASLGACATTISGCAKWNKESVEALEGRDVWILEDNDDTGRKKSRKAAEALYGRAKTVRIVRLPGLAEREDVSDWLNADAERDLDALASAALDSPLWEPGNATGLESKKASDFEMRAIEWLWPGRFALGKIGLIAGLPDEGKGQILCNIIAAVTTPDSEWPCQEGIAPHGNVLLLTAEDDIADTVAPRLEAAGADRSKVEVIQMVREGKNGRMFSLITDLELLEQKVAQVGNVKLIIIDPISAYLGVKKIDSFRTSDVRAVLSPLTDLAARLGIAIIGIMHFNKKTDVTNALLRISDSLAFGAVARHVYAVVDDPENKRKLFVKGKNNLVTKEQKALAYDFGAKQVGTDPETGQPIWAPHIIWHPQHVDVTASEAMHAANEGRSPGAKNEAKEFLEDMLRNGPKPAKEVEEAAAANLISMATLRRAKADLKVTARKQGLEGGWSWEMPRR